MASSARERVKSLIQVSPPGLKRIVYRAMWAPVDLFETATGQRPDDVPPRGLRRYVGAGDYESARANYMRHLVELGELQPTDRVLDVGCGIGRMAGPLTSYLSEGSYDGIDIVPQGITWANQHIAAKHPRFRFTVCDVFNDYYHRAGTQSAAAFRFPFADDSFDFIFATSLYTHLMPDAAANYLRETGRVLAPGGRCLLTFIVLDDVAFTAIDEGRAAMTWFPDDQQDPPRWWTINPRNPEATIGFAEAQIRAWYDDAGLVIDEPIRYGTWSGRPGLDGQDIIFARSKG